jgi:Na+/glutamate symporter
MRLHSEECFFLGKGGAGMTDKVLEYLLSRIALKRFFLILYCTFVGLYIICVVILLDSIHAHRYLYSVCGFPCSLFTRIIIREVKDITKLANIAKRSRRNDG